ncbi:MAG: non-hydrolyzing UDP-N-acetylglucosamine 2-epimerase [Nocardioidaceae bacterium]
MTHIVTVVGARPQFIKAATVSRALTALPDVEEVLVHTGQHFDPEMSQVFFDDLDIPKPAHNLAVAGGSHGQMTGRQLEKIEDVLLAERPDVLLVYGDTNSTMAGALAAAKLDVPVAHVEAGLRSFDRRMPEEVNRIVTDHVSRILFAPSDLARSNLLAEGIPEHSIELVGDVMYDAALFYRQRARRPALPDEDLPDGYVLVTVHRQGNTDNPARLGSIIEGLAGSGRPMVWPVHPRTRARLEEFGIDVPPSIRMVPPVGYLEMIWLQVNSAMVVTDSGGVQKEAFFHAKPCITLRDETEWVELVEAGYQRLVGSSAAGIIAALEGFEMPAVTVNPYGAGDAAMRVAQTLSRQPWNGSTP